MKKRVRIPNREASPPTMERDPNTGRYLQDKRQAITSWFKSAKNSGSDVDEYKWSIDPKQAVYLEEPKQPEPIKPTRKKKKQ